MTRETAWTLPNSEQELSSPEVHQQTAAAASATSHTTASAAVPLSQDEMLLQLLDAVQADQTGMLFAETARSLRYELYGAFGRILSSKREVGCPGVDIGEWHSAGQLVCLRMSSLTF